MNHDTHNDSWLNVLAGKGQPEDLMTRQAESLRHFFALEAEHTPALTEATERRILNGLQAKGAFSAAAVHPASKQPGLLARLQNWWAPAGRSSTHRWSAVAAAMVAVAVIPFVLQMHGSGDDDATGIKSLDPAQGAAGGMLVVIDTLNPQQLAGQLVRALSQQGVMAEQRMVGADYWVQAQVPVEKIPAVQSELAAFGLAVGSNGQLNVQFRRAP